MKKNDYGNKNYVADAAREAGIDEDEYGFFAEIYDYDLKMYGVPDFLVECAENSPSEFAYFLDETYEYGILDLESYAISEVEKFVDEDEHPDWQTDFLEIFRVVLPTKEIMDSEIKVCVLLDTGNANYDFSCDSLLETDGKFEDLPETSSMRWLCEKKGYNLDKIIEKEKNGEELNNFETEVYQEILDACNYMNALTFNVTMKLQDFIDLRFALTTPVEKRKGYIKLLEGYCGLFNPWVGGGSDMSIRNVNSIDIPMKNVFNVISVNSDIYGYSYSSVYDEPVNSECSEYLGIFPDKK